MDSVVGAADDVRAGPRHRLQLDSVRHGFWLVNADPAAENRTFPEVRRAATTLCKQHRHYADGMSALYRVVRECLTNDWRGLAGTPTSRDGEARQQILPPDTPVKDRYLLARTEHWSMLPEAAAVITVPANDYHHATATTMTSQSHLARSLNCALNLGAERQR